MIFSINSLVSFEPKSSEMILTSFFMKLLFSLKINLILSLSNVLIQKSLYVPCIFFSAISCIDGTTHHGGIYKLIIGIDSERLGHSASWEPLGGSPELPQLGPEIGGSGGSHRVASS